MRGDHRPDRAIDANTPEQGLIEIFGEVISVLEKNGKYLEAIGLNPVTAGTYRKVVAYLKRRTDKEIVSIIGIRKPTKRPARKRSDPRMSDAEMHKLSREQIRGFLTSAEVSRKFLEQVASIRFGVSAGALSELRDRDALVNKLSTLVGHEGTHDAISRAIESSDNSPVQTSLPVSPSKGVDDRMDS